MVYDIDILNSNLTENNKDIEFNSLNIPPVKVVKVEYANSGVQDITGPTPVISISSNIESSNTSMPEINVTKITLEGTIVRTGRDSSLLGGPGSGVGPVMSGISRLRDLFEKNPNSTLKIICRNSNANPLLSLTGVRLVSMNFPKSADNWIFTADYSIELEHVAPIGTGAYVKNTKDSWEIEPLQDMVYTEHQVDQLLQRAEYHNPNLRLNTRSRPINPNRGGTPTIEPFNLKIVGVPTVKISHTVSAVGIPSGTGIPPFNAAYLNAKKWVENRLNSSFLADQSGIINLNALPNNNTLSSTNVFPHVVTNTNANLNFLYDHIRTINFSISDGSYEVTDSWISLPTGVAFTEEYTIAVTTDDAYIHTVVVNGSIKGLKPASNLFMSSGSYITTHPAWIPNNNNTAPQNVKLSLNSLIDSPPDTAGSPRPMSAQPPPANNFDAIPNRPTTPVYAHQYANANSGWLNDIKPFLYRRACLAFNSRDRDETYIPSTNNRSTIQQPPNNPVYSKHGLLNIIPIATSETHNPRKGTIDYSYTFNNKFTIISGVLFENISIDDTGPTDIITETMVLGRALGPVIQNLGTTTSAKKSIRIEIGVVPPSGLQGFFMTQPQCPLFTGGTVYNTIQTLISGFQPFGDRRANSVFGTSDGGQGVGSSYNRTDMLGQVYVTEDTHSWNPTEGRFSRNVSWTYQQCNTNKRYLDH
jgi:hypothetical protein